MGPEGGGGMVGLFIADQPIRGVRQAKSTPGNHGNPENEGFNYLDVFSPPRCLTDIAALALSR